MLRAAVATGAAVIALPLIIVVLFAASSAWPAQAVSGAGGATLGTSPTALARQDIPASYLILYMDAAQTCPGLPWPVLAGIGKVESDHGRSTLPGVSSGSNSAGAEGPMQFEPATFAEYAVNADPGQPLSPYDPADAIYTAARMLCANGALDHIRQAIFAYNHAGWYVSEVLSWAARYAAAAPTTPTPSGSPTAPASHNNSKP